MSMHDDVIEVYGRRQVDNSMKEIETSATFEELLAKHSTKEGFDQECAYVRELCTTLQALLAKQRPETQVKMSLKLLYQSNDNKRQDYHQLIKLAYWPDWSGPQQAHYDLAHEVISGNVYYFLSFTNHNLAHGHVNIVNRNHRGLIEDVFYNQKREEIGDYAKENLLAKVIYYFLKSNGLKGFYYPMHEGNNAVVRQKLLTNLQTALAFVQIVHTAIFEKDPGANYCFFEYDSVRKSNLCKKRYFVLAQSRDDLKGRVLAHNDFEPWRDEIIDLVDAPVLEHSVSYDDKVIKRNTDLIKEKIVSEIEKLSLELFEKIPA